MVSRMLLAVALFLAPATGVASDYFAELKVKIEAARGSLIDMLGGKTDAAQQALVKSSADAVSAALKLMQSPKGQEATLKELADTWATFKKVREDELVPLILAGKVDDARKLATGVQKERMDKMMRALGALIGNEL